VTWAKKDLEVNAAETVRVACPARKAASATPVYPVYSDETAPKENLAITDTTVSEEIKAMPDHRDHPEESDAVDPVHSGLKEHPDLPVYPD